MNILFVLSKKSWGGVNTWTTSVINHLIKQGHTVTLVTSHRSPKIPTVGAAKQIQISFGPDFNPITMLYFLYLMVTRKIDLVVANIEKDIMMVGPACKLLNKPLIRHIGSYEDFHATKKKTKWIHQLFVTYGICTSEAVKYKSKERCPWIKTPIEVIYSGVKQAAYPQRSIEDLKKQLDLNENDFILGITARLAKEKRIDFLLKSLAPIFKNRSNLKLVITGSGEEELHLKALASSLEIQKNIRFFGHTNEPMLFAHLYDICYLVSSYESFPFSIVEYMAAGKPTIATAVGGIPEGITHGENGFLIDPDDTEGLLKYTELLISDSSTRNRMGSSASARFFANHTEEQMVANFEKWAIKIGAKYA